MKFPTLSTRLSGSLCIAIAAMTGAVPANAETLSVSGIYPAQSDDAVDVHSIAVEDFSGDAGTQLSFAVTDALGDVTIQGDRWFNVVPMASAGDPPDAIMRGIANTEVQSLRARDKTVKKCVEKDDNGKCLREADRKIPCRTLQVTFNPDVRLMSTGGGTIYSRRDSIVRSQTYCSDSSVRPTTDSLLKPMVEQFAGTLRYDLAPVARREDIRVLESRDGLRKEDKDAFKRAIKLTKHDPYGACQAFSALEQANPQSVSVLFNIGLCLESEGKLDKAAEYYRRAAAADPGKNNPGSGLGRISSRRRAEQQLQEHGAG